VLIRDDAVLAVLHILSHLYLEVQWAIPAFTPGPQSITSDWLAFICRPTEDRRLSWPGQYYYCLVFFIVASLMWKINMIKQRHQLRCDNRSS